MKPPPPPKTARCAIYTRKSTDHNLDLEFNSLDAQREACEAYIKSQAHEGWRLIPDRFDDGGLSGASLERPALKSLLALIENGQIDVIVVYKVDRLTRSLADFAKLVELFDCHGVSFVSITQAFNTTTSMGRLTLNVLLSFAQFEREVIGERVRDKIAASKRKGIWVGGPVPLGYASVNKKIVIVPDEAENVRAIFRRYLELNSVRLLADDLDKCGVKTKERRLSSGRSVGGGRFGVGALSHFLKNRFYIGEVAYRGELHAGEHEPIIERSLFDEVQLALSNNNVERQLATKPVPAPLTGRIFDDRGNAMVPSHTKKKGVRYRYYVSSAVLQKRDNKVGSVRRVSATDVEELILSGLRNSSEKIGLPHQESETLWVTIERVEVGAGAIAVHLQKNQSREKSGEILSLPWQPSLIAFKGVAKNASEEVPPLNVETRDTLLTAIAKARMWLDDLLSGQSMEAIACRESKGVRQIRLLLPLAFTPPKTLRDIVAGSPTMALTVTSLAKTTPLIWDIKVSGKESRRRWTSSSITT